MRDRDAELDSFKRTLDILTRLKESKELFISLAPPFNVSFEVDREALKPLLRGTDTSRAEFDSAADQIGDLLLAVLEDDVDGYVRRVMQSRRFERSEQEPPSDLIEERQLHERAGLVRAALHDEHLRSRYALKTTSKAPSFSAIDWDVKVKIEDADLEDLTPFPYATCKIHYQREYGDTPWSYLGRGVFDSVQINLSVDEVDHLLRVFRTIRIRLAQAEGKEWA
jgi:hypothetical protein